MECWPTQTVAVNIFMEELTGTLAKEAEESTERCFSKWGGLCVDREMMIEKKS